MVDDGKWRGEMYRLFEIGTLATPVLWVTFLWIYPTVETLMALIAVTHLNAAIVAIMFKEKRKKLLEG